ncbi:cytosolic phospholipase A2-like [Brienomyrus brachyistius]|uniref:cytosolic phospholipase A2-like n=1 Tax=Brienomyrus brachyistius TaxID=42636 RepID=UPI0020B2CE66|nr:cytosolic phospholipase A2-like [Brienomyrus brachyistius]
MSAMVPYQYIIVENQHSHKFRVTVVRAENVTKGGWGDYLDIPDPYVELCVPAVSKTKKRTKHIDGSASPEWNETFEFILDPSQENVLEVTLMDANYVKDETLGTASFTVSDIEVGQTRLIPLLIGKATKVYLEMTLQVCSIKDLRLSLALCDKEKLFQEARRQKVMLGIQKLLKTEKSCFLPSTPQEVPVIAVMGSGGGFRAMVGFAGVMKALFESGVLDCTTYIAGLSGSTWYMSTLYSHPHFPAKGPSEINQELKKSVANSPMRLLTLQHISQYVHALQSKKAAGQPVTFTDVFGMLIGNTLIPGCMDRKLSQMAEKVDDARNPLPLFTCLHVKPDVSELIFADWVEFSPYEIGMVKYGTFMTPDLFGSKFFMGSVVKRFEESPLHFLMGVWGSAFAILFNRLLGGQAHRRGSTLEEELEHIKPVHIVGEGDEDEDGRGNDSHPQEQNSWPPRMFTSLISNSAVLKSREGRASKVHNFMWGLRLNTFVPYSPFGGLNKEASAAPDADAVKEPNEFNRIYEPLDPNSKKIYMVDSGLSFNLPYPLILRPQREVDLVISFDFTARPSDSSPPFKELLLAEKWARLNKLPFPKIDPKVFDREGLKECYVFKPEDGQKNCPTIIHFVLANINFRNFKSPGVPRESQVEQESADFDIFDDPEKIYSTFNFHYSTEAFARLHDLMEFNTLNNIQVIKDAIKHCVLERRGNPPCAPTSPGNRNEIKKKAVSEE